MGESPAGYKINYWHFCASLDLNEENKEVGEMSLKDESKKVFSNGIIRIAIFW